MRQAPRLIHRAAVVLSAVAAVLFTVSGAILWAQGASGRAMFATSCAIACGVNSYLQWRAGRR